MSKKYDMRRFKRLSQIEDCWAQGKDARVSPEVIKLRDELMLKDLLLKEHRLKCAQTPIEVEAVVDDHPKKKKKKLSHKNIETSSNINKTCEEAGQQQ